jgi:hypothetical protein
MIVGLLALLFVVSQSTPPPPAAVGCKAPEFTQFDFWLGEWEVFAPNGTRAGTNSITRDHGGCVLVERWTGTRGLNGSSFNIYTPATRKWHQVWVDNSGTLLQLEGEFVDGAMRMQGDGLTAKGAMLNRITWTPQGDGSVRQFWEISTDKGQTWQVSFDGVYRKARK